MGDLVLETVAGFRRPWGERVPPTPPPLFFLSGGTLPPCAGMAGGTLPHDSRENTGKIREKPEEPGKKPEENGKVRCSFFQTPAVYIPGL